MGHYAVVHARRLARRISTLADIWFASLASVVKLASVTHAVSGHKTGRCGAAWLQRIYYELVVLQILLIKPTRCLSLGLALIESIAAVGLDLDVLCGTMRMLLGQLVRVWTTHGTLIQLYTSFEHHSPTSRLDLSIAAFIYRHRVSEEDNIFLCSLLAAVETHLLLIHKKL